MKNSEFDKILDARLKKIRKVLSKKGIEYSPDENDRLHNFKRAGEMHRQSPEKALMGMKAKHTISILDIVDEIEAKCGTNKDCFPAYDVKEYMKKVNEKIGDEINYLILLEALIYERYKQVCNMPSLDLDDIDPEEYLKM